MPRNRSVNEARTKKALSYYYDKAKKNGMISTLLQEGGFNEAAIRTAMSRGRISLNMINVFVKVLGADARELTGEIELGGNSKELDGIYLTEEQTLKIMKLVVIEREIVRVKVGIDKILHGN